MLVEGQWYGIESHEGAITSSSLGRWPRVGLRLARPLKGVQRFSHRLAHVKTLPIA